MFGKVLHQSSRICSGASPRSRRVLGAVSYLSSTNPGSSGSSKGSEKTGRSATSGMLANSNLRKKTPLPVDVIGKKLYDAVKEVTQELHQENAELREKTQKELIEKLMEHEKATFDAATGSQTDEMLSDMAVIDLLKDVKSMKQKPVAQAAKIRHARRGLALLRRDVFYQAQQSGYSAEKARKIAEHALEIAEARAIAQSKREAAERSETLSKEEAEMAHKDEKERKLYSYAFEMAKKILSPVMSEFQHKLPLSTINPYESYENIFTSEGADLGIFDKKSLSSMEERKLGYWRELDENAVGFHEHIFLEKELEQYELPKSGPVAHFMELVCVGLSKNSYMTIQKKRDHLKWFAYYFNEKKVEEINRLHQSERELLS